LSGDGAEARDNVARWVREREVSYHPIDKHDALATCAEALVAFGDLVTVSSVLHESARRADIRFSRIGAVGLDRLRGLLALRLEDFNGAQHWLDRAAGWASSHELLAEGLLVEFAYAQLEVEAIRSGAGIRRAQEAAFAASRHGLWGIYQRIDRWLVSISGVDVAEARRGTSGSLTRREGEVLRLVASGSTNRQIAIALAISPHTANRHLSNILLKLDAANRAEAVKRALDLGIV
jgi:DNA-binding CsgD family transcriptional regulator